MKHTVPAGGLVERSEGEAREIWEGEGVQDTSATKWVWATVSKPWARGLDGRGHLA